MYKFYIILSLNKPNPKAESIERECILKAVFGFCVSGECLAIS